MAILERLSACLLLLLVGNSDQAIYGFRDDGAAVLGAAAPVPKRTVHLPHNWRSSQTICDTAATLRTSRRASDTATGPHRADEVPVLLIELLYSGTGHVQAFSRKADELGLATAERVVLSHVGFALPAELAGVVHPPPGRLGRLLWAVDALRAPAAPAKQVERARRSVRENILDRWYGESGMSVEERIERFGLLEEGLTRAEKRVLAELPPLREPVRAWCESAGEAFARHRLGRCSDAPIGCLAWSADEPAVAGSDPGVTAVHLIGRGRVHSARAEAMAGVRRFSTVHQFKGKEADAVLVVAPDPSGPDFLTPALDSWLAQHTPVRPEVVEARNVLYVAASRARRLLAFALKPRRLEPARALLAGRGIPCEVVRGPGRWHRAAGGGDALALAAGPSTAPTGMPTSSGAAGRRQRAGLVARADPAGVRLQRGCGRG